MWAKVDSAPVRAEPWRRTSGIHRVRGRRGLALVRSMWELRDRIAQGRDITTNRIVPDAAIVEAAQAAPRSRNALGRLPGFATRSGQRYAKEFATAINEAFELPETELPTLGQQHDGPPPPRSWADKNPEAADRLGRCREVISSLATEHELPQENLISPDFVRRLAWEPPVPTTLDNVRQTLADNGARPWQLDLTAELLTEALAGSDD